MNLNVSVTCFVLSSVSKQKGPLKNFSAFPWFTPPVPEFFGYIWPWCFDFRPLVVVTLAAARARAAGGRTSAALHVGSAACARRLKGENVRGNYLEESHRIHVNGRLMLTWLGYIDGKCYHIWHTWKKTETSLPFAKHVESTNWTDVEK